MNQSKRQPWEPLIDAIAIQLYNTGVGGVVAPAAMKIDGVSEAFTAPVLGTAGYRSVLPVCIWQEPFMPSNLTSSPVPGPSSASRRQSLSRRCCRCSRSLWPDWPLSAVALEAVRAVWGTFAMLRGQRCAVFPPASGGACRLLTRICTLTSSTQSGKTTTMPST